MLNRQPNCEASFLPQRAPRDERLELAAAEFAPRRVDHAADEGVVDRIPDLEHDEDSRERKRVNAHVLRVKQREVRARERETHVAAEVSGRVGEFVQHAERAPGCRALGVCRMSSSCFAYLRSAAHSAVRLRLYTYYTK